MPNNSESDSLSYKTRNYIWQGCGISLKSCYAVRPWGFSSPFRGLQITNVKFSKAIGGRYEVALRSNMEKGLSR